MNQQPNPNRSPGTAALAANMAPGRRMPAPKTKPLKIKRPAPIAELTFDPTARKEYLTGFHKRKLARIKAAREAAAKIEKEANRAAKAQVRPPPPGASSGRC